MTLRRLPRIVQLKLATVDLPDWHLESRRSPTSDVFGYVIDHPDGLIIFDTGVGTGNDLIDELYNPDVVTLDDALADGGLSREVVAVVNSHLHFDHCGQNPVLYGTDVPFFVGRSEIEAVSQDPLYTVAAWALPPVRQRVLVEQDLAIAEGVTVLTAPGHTPGHLALLVEAAERRVVIAGQAVWHHSEFVDEVATEANVADGSLRSSAVETIRRLKALRPDTVFFAHCCHYEP